MDKAEFDRFADEYYAQLEKGIKASGEQPEYFAEYKIKESLKCAKENGVLVDDIMDFGSGIGSSIPWFRKYFPGSSLTCADVSSRSLDISKSRFPGNEINFEIKSDCLDLPDCSFDLVFSACVFHHIPHEEHSAWLSELYRILRPGGLLIIFEHNPLNPVTVATVCSCPFDINAKLIKAKKIRQLVNHYGWGNIETRYHIFFPRALAIFRPFERFLYRLSLGAQYSILAMKQM